MQQMRVSTKYKSAQKMNAFISVIISWYGIADVKITLPEDLENSTKEIQELLEDFDKRQLQGKMRL